MSKIGIFGGSFDPIHLGHTKVIKCAIKQLNLDKLLIIPTKNNPWKDGTVLSNKDRLNTIALAIKDIKEASIDTIEIDNPGNDKNYTIETLLQLKTKYKNDDLYYMMGYDQALKFHMWYKAHEISELVNLVTFDRDEYTGDTSNIKDFNFIKLDIEASDESSTLIKEGHIEMLDSQVVAYLSNNNLMLDSLIKLKMNEKRYKHTLSVAKLASEFARSNNLDDKKAYIAGMLHDVAKQMNKELEYDLMNRFYKKYLDKPEPIYHQWLSSYVAQNEFGVFDKEVLQAIEYHTRGDVNMDLLDMCVYCADKLDPLRGYDSSKGITLCHEDIKKGFAFCLKDFYDFSKKKNREIDICFYEIYKKFVEGDLNE